MGVRRGGRKEIKTKTESRCGVFIVTLCYALQMHQFGLESQSVSDSRVQRNKEFELNCRSSSDTTNDDAREGSMDFWELPKNASFTV